MTGAATRNRPASGASGRGGRNGGLPAWVEPQLATLTSERFSDPGWLYERKLDGERCLAFRDGGEVRLLTRNRKDANGAYPEIAGALAAVRAGGFIADGEVVAFDGSSTSFARLQQRIHVHHPSAELRARVPVYYYLFDLLYAGGEDVRSRPLRERKQRLRELLSFDDPLRFTEWTSAGQLRHPRFQGLRRDKDAAEVVREDG